MGWCLVSDVDELWGRWSLERVISCWVNRICFQDCALCLIKGVDVDECAAIYFLAGTAKGREGGVNYTQGGGDRERRRERLTRTCVQYCISCLF